MPRDHYMYVHCMKGHCASYNRFCDHAYCHAGTLFFTRIDGEKTIGSIVACHFFVFISMLHAVVSKYGNFLIVIKYFLDF